MRQRILALKNDDEKKEIEFELDYLLSLTTQKRFQMMFSKSQEMLKLLKNNEGRKTPLIIKRT